MIDQQQRIHNLVKDELKRLALGEDIGFAVAQVFGPMPVPGGQPGQMAISPGWLITVTMRNPLMGYTDIGNAWPIAGVMPPDAAFKMVAEKLLEDCRNDKNAILRGEMNVPQTQ